MKTKYLFQLFFIVLLLYIIYEVYLYKQEGCNNTIFYVTNYSTKTQEVDIKVFLDDKLLIDDKFQKTDFYFGKKFKFDKRLGLKKLTVKVNGEIKYKGYFLLLGVRWVSITNHSGPKDKIQVNYYFKERVLL